MRRVSKKPGLGAAVIACSFMLVVSAAVLADATEPRSARPDNYARPAVDLILYNGKVSLLDDKNSTVAALAIDDGRIVATGSNSAVRSIASRSTKYVDLHGRRVVPGLIDGHLHGLRGGYQCWTQTVRLDEVTDREAALSAYAAKANELAGGKWIWTTFGQWNLRQLDDPRPFTFDELTTAAPDNPVWVTGLGISGPRVNQAALDAAGLTADSAGVAVDENGNPTGAISSPATAAVNSAILGQLDRHTIETEAACLSDFLKEAVSRGLTSFRDAGGNTAPFKATGAITDGLHGEEPAMWLYRNEGLPVRIAYNQMSRYGGPAAAMEDLRNAVGPLGDDWLKYLGPGEDIMATAPGYVDFLKMVAQKRLSVETHVGDVDAILDGFEAANRVQPIAELNWMIAHPEAAEPTDLQIERANAMNVGFNMTTTSVLVGAASARFQSVSDSGAKYCLASDGTVAPWLPFQTLWYTTTGQTMVPGAPGVPADQRLTRLDALRHATVDCAWVMDQEGELGSLEVGNFADLLVLDRDYFTVADSKIREIRPLVTVVDGEVKHAAGPYKHLDPDARPGSR